MRTRKTFSKTFPSIFFLLLVVTGCSSSTQDMFADTLGVSPDFEDTTDSKSAPEVVTAVNELAIKDPTARASLRREEVVPQEEKKKIIPLTTTKPEQSSLSTDATNSVAPAKKITIEKNAPVKLNQLYFDNRDRAYWQGEVAKDLVRFSKTSYAQSENSSQIINQTYSDSPEFVRLEALLAKANDKVGASGMPIFVIPAAMLMFALIIAAAALGYNYELKRIKAAEKNELAKKNLWNKGLTEPLPPR